MMSRKKPLLMWMCRRKCGGKPCFLILTDEDPMQVSDPKYCPWYSGAWPEWVLIVENE